jgi:hypothetical protein
MWGQHVYRDSRNRRSIIEGDAFVDLVLTRLARSGYHCEKIVDSSRQIRCGDAVVNGDFVEIKLDNVCTRSSRLSIEIAEKTKIGTSWIPSGIYAPSVAVWYIQGNPAIFYVFRRSDLRRFFEDTNPEIKDTNPATIKNFYLPMTSIRQVDLVSCFAWTPVPDGYWTTQECDGVSGSVCRSDDPDPRRLYLSHSDCASTQDQS